MTSPWDVNDLAHDVDVFWEKPSECDFRNAVVNDLAPRLVAGALLDVGCGSGRFYEALYERGLLANRNYLGLDSSHAMLELARARCPAGDFDYMDIYDLHKRAPNVLCVQVLQHLADWHAPLTQLLRATEHLLYLVTWFGADMRAFDQKTGVWNNWLPYTELAAVAAQYGHCTFVDLGAPSGALVVEL